MLHDSRGHYQKSKIEDIAAQFLKYSDCLLISPGAIAKVRSRKLEEEKEISEKEVSTEIRVLRLENEKLQRESRGRLDRLEELVKKLAE